MTRLSDLRSRVTLLKRRIIERDDGSFEEAWQAGDSVWAQVVPSGAQEGIGEGWNKLTPAPLKYKVTLRFRRGRFGRVQLFFDGEGPMTLALLCPPFIDQRRQWMTCLIDFFRNS